MTRRDPGITNALSSKSAVHCPGWALFGGAAALLGCGGLLALPKVSLDSEGIHTHRHGLGRDLGEPFAVRVVLIDAFDHGRGDSTRPVACQPRQLLCLPGQSVESPELAA